MSGSAAISTLCENPTEVFLDVSRLLITYADNILRNPNEEKYRSIRIGNATFSTKLLPVKGAVECLFEMGFEEAETHLVFPQSASVGKLRQVRENIAAERNQRLETSTPSPSPSAAALPFTSSSVTFLRSLQSNFQHVLVYESPDLQQKALSSMPHALLRSRAEERLGRAREADPDCTLDTEDMLVLDLLQWFKGEFFSWVDSLPCGQCGGRTQASGSLQPSDDDRRWDAGRVENHYCETCQISTRFPRYNHPEKLLESRRGRCGEWANCFTLCCRALGLEARYIWDSTDHVWTEVFSQSQGRWVHCDPCENACDKPLLYEVGWGKKLSYILAFSKDQVVDVTWRYSCKHQEVLSRRSQVQETWLLHTLNNLNSTRQQSLGAQRKQQLLERLLMEQVEFISPKSPQSGDLGGRVSGSLAWRAARGETGNARKDATERVFVPSEAEKREKRFHICYNMVKDCYFRPSSGQETITGWQSGAWRIENVFRKEEHDWKMVYLARTEGAAFGRISWKFNCSESGMSITSASVRASSQTFHSGSVCWSLISPHNTTQFPADGEFHSGVNVAGSGELMVEAELTGGDGDEAWQHAQLFRQSLTDTQKLSLEILVEMEESEEHPSTSL